jgi:pilus assembly protein CpaD
MTRMRDTPLVRRRPFRSLALLSLPMLALTAPLAGCQDYDALDDTAALRLSDPEKRHPIHFSRRTETMNVEVPSDAGGLDPGQEADVYRFLDRYKADGTGPLRLSTPSAQRERLAGQNTLRDVERLIRDLGIAPRAVVAGRHETSPERGPMLKLSYERPVAVPPKCGDWSEEVGPNPERLPYANFGCATQRNVALMVATPRDLQQPQPEDPRSSERRSAGWSGYIGSGGGGTSSGGGGDAKASAAPAAK